jgi:hypothetical protein
MLIAFFTWWYGNGWRQTAQNFMPRISVVLYGFSVSQLLKTLFAPWKRIITPSGRSLEERFHAAGENLFSRAVGFVVRIGVLLAALFFVIIVVVLSVIEIISWPLLPLAVPGFIILGLVV